MSWIADSKSQESGFYDNKFPGFRILQGKINPDFGIRITLHCAISCLIKLIWNWNWLLLLRPWDIKLWFNTLISSRNFDTRKKFKKWHFERQSLVRKKKNELDLQTCTFCFVTFKKEKREKKSLSLSLLKNKDLKAAGNRANYHLVMKGVGSIRVPLLHWQRDMRCNLT